MTAQLPLVFPVIHHLNESTTFSEIQVARTCGADGVFLISHEGADLDLLGVARTAIRENAGFPIGLNLLSMGCVQACKAALVVGSNMIWADDMGVDSQGLTAEGREMENLARKEPDLKLFASVAFKYRPHEPDPVSAAAQAREAGLIPTTSGDATGHAPDPRKIVAMGEGGPLAIASGMTPENVLIYAPALTHILVATGVSRTEHHIDPARLRALIDKLSSARLL
ncbi:BtpA/SgcQ family protein [Acidovorax sp.]|uniref:BtpA/SgcQ family protein n=1 Tax=Acidovorax sp. TaxID=1872122 RepID=UPI0025C17202|nr:BtpA/SgcQ family protein [Acidovorax sp.]